MVTRREWGSLCLWWTAILSSALLLKYYYSVATANDLQWMLRPLAFLVESLTGMQFVVDGAGNWVNGRSNVAIIKSCAGINFMIMSLFVYAQCFRPRTASVDCASVRLLMTLGGIAACLSAAGAAALLVNTIRILVATQLYRYEITFPGLDPEQLHRLAGVLIFFPALWLQFHMFVKLRARRAWGMAAACYLGLMVLAPLMTGNARVNLNLYAEHVLVTGCLILVPLLLFYLIPDRILTHWRNCIAAADTRQNPRGCPAAETANAGSSTTVQLPARSARHGS